MKYKNIDWEITINGETAKENCDGLDYIAREVDNGNVRGNFDIDVTDYDKCDNLKQELENALGREVDFDIERDDKGELNDLLDIARKNKDTIVEQIILDIFENGF